MALLLIFLSHLIYGVPTNKPKPPPLQVKLKLKTIDKAILTQSFNLVPPVHVTHFRNAMGCKKEFFILVSAIQTDLQLTYHIIINNDGNNS